MVVFFYRYWVVPNGSLRNIRASFPTIITHVDTNFSIVQIHLRPRLGHFYPLESGGVFIFPSQVLSCKVCIGGRRHIIMNKVVTLLSDCSPISMRLMVSIIHRSYFIQYSCGIFWLCIIDPIYPLALLRSRVCLPGRVLVGVQPISF